MVEEMAEVEVVGLLVWPGSGAGQAPRPEGFEQHGVGAGEAHAIAMGGVAVVLRKVRNAELDRGGIGTG